AFDRADFYDAELRRHDEHFRAALKVGPGDRVLDIGCGAGRSTRDAARLAVRGSVVGVDVSEEMLEAARQRSAAEGLRNIVFEQADAQSQAFPVAHFDLCVSRFGVMFFADPVAAFTNLARAMRPGARLVLMVWQGRDRNEWATALQGVLAPDDSQVAPAPPAFSLGDPAVTTGVLTAAGFVSIAFAEVREPVFYGPDISAAYEAIVELFLAKRAPAGELFQRLGALLDAHLTADGVLFDSRAWIVTAHRATKPPGGR
ncbi:MAG: Methylase involved in ubiquinone/menaquinone biosynthesis, partial [Caulobacter sp.]|nr:Methylase involved in ubiquinone/menaquinone biosynthesis [Caulobacter sp.]